MLAQVGVGRGGASEHPGRRVQPQGLGDDSAGQLQSWQIFKACDGACEDSVDLGVQPAFDLGMGRQQVHRPGQSGRGGLRAREEERDDLVDDLGVGQALAVGGVAGG
jgi:hypothetical protein